VGVEITDIIKQLMNSGQTGLLSVKIEDENFLLKVYLESGRVVYVSIGEQKGQACVEKIKNGKVVGHFFMAGAKPANSEPSSIALALNDLIPQISRQIAASNTIAKIVSQSADGGTGSVGAKVLSELEEAFIDIMGPIGVLILNDRYSGLSYVRGETMIAKNYHALLSFIVDELPEAKKAPFLEKFRRN
jgi:hypothetical protein